MVTRMHTRGWSDISGEESTKIETSGKRQKSDARSKPANGDVAKSSSKQPVPVAQKIIYDYDVDPYDYKDDTLTDAVMEMLKHYDIFRIFSFDIAQMRRFVNHVKLFYNPKNLFHNFKHVWGVLHLSFQILTHGGDKYLHSLDIFAIVVAALCHDIQHPGNNNAFELATASDWSKAKSYNVDAGILERHHATITQSLLNADGTDYDILVGMDASQKEHFRRQVALIILGTDMAKHASILAEAQGYQRDASVPRSADETITAQTNGTQDNKNGTIEDSNGKAKSLKSSAASRKHFTIRQVSCSQIAYDEAKPARRGAVDANDPESRLAFTRVLVHSADIGAQTQCTKVALQWMNRCYGEFRSQAEREEMLGIVTSPFLHDLKEDNKTFSAQHSFIEEIVQPLWEALSNFLPELTFAREQLLVNKEGYKKMLADYLSEKKSSELNSKSGKK